MLAVAIALVASAPAAARDALGIYGSWGAFRDATPNRCYAIAEPIDASGARWRPFASVGHWPGEGVRAQLHIRLSRERRGSAPVMLQIDDRRWKLVASRTDAWAPSAAHDAHIVARLRSGKAMLVSSIAATGARFIDTYRLKGAASAIDAAALGCAGGR